MKMISSAFRVMEKSSQSSWIHSSALRDEKNRGFVSCAIKEAK